MNVGTFNDQPLESMVSLSYYLAFVKPKHAIAKQDLNPIYYAFKEFHTKKNHLDILIHILPSNTLNSLTKMTSF
jgi:hypothetical protein